MLCLGPHALLIAGPDLEARPSGVFLYLFSVQNIHSFIEGPESESFFSSEACLLKQVILDHSTLESVSGASDEAQIL